jgi:hypothetical protein
MSDASAIDAIIARDRLNLAPEDRERLITIYAETQTELANLRSLDLRLVEPAIIYSADLRPRPQRTDYDRGRNRSTLSSYT